MDHVDNIWFFKSEIDFVWIFVIIDCVGPAARVIARVDDFVWILCDVAEARA